MRQVVLNFAFKSERQGDDGKRRLRFAAHGENIAHGMVGGDLAENVGVVDEGPEGVHCMDHHLAFGDPYHGGVIGFMQADQHIVPFHRFQSRKCALQDGCAHFGAATAAPHRHRRDFLDHILVGEALRDVGFFVIFHVGEVAEFPHEAPVDPVFPTPNHFSFRGPVRA